MSFPDKPRSPKKRRINADLLDYFDPVPKLPSTSSHQPRIADNWIWGRLPTEVLHKSVFKFLRVQDLTNLGHSCHQLKTLVDAYRGPLPHIVREELSAPKIHYVNLDPASASPPSPCYNYYNVNRTRTMRFLLKTARHRIVQVEIRLGYLLWTEVHHWVVLASKKNPWVEVKIYRQTKQPTSGLMERVQLFENVVTYHDGMGSLCYYLEGYDRSPEEQYLELQKQKQQANKKRTLPPPVSLAVEANQQASVDYIYKCAQRIARSPACYQLPTLDYLLDQALPPSLRHLLKYTIHPSPSPPRPPALWKYLKAPSAKARRQVLGASSQRDQHGQWTREFDIWGLSWFREWYPKPVVLYEKNLLQSLPPKLVVRHILPFLGDSRALGEVRPRVRKELLSTVPN